MAVGVVGIAGNISLALTPAVALVIMDAAGFAAVGWAVCAVLTVGALLIWPVTRPAARRPPAAHRPPVPDQPGSPSGAGRCS